MGEAGPIKTISKLSTTPIAPAHQIPALDPKLLVTSKVTQSEFAAVSLAKSLLFLQALGPPCRHHCPAKVTEKPSKVTLAALPDCKAWP